MPNINYSVEADWSIGGGDEGDRPYVRLTDEQKRKVIMAVWAAVFDVEYDGEEANGSVMGSIVLKETVFNDDGIPRTSVTVYDPNEDRVASV